MATDCASRMAPLISPSDGAPHQVFPLLAGALELSPEEVARARAGHLAHLAGGSSGLISTETLWGLISPSTTAPATAPAAAPASAAAGAMGAGAALPPPKLLGAEPPPSAMGAVAGAAGAVAGGAVGAVAGAVADAAAAEAAATKEKMNRMKKLLAAADKRIEQASAEVKERDARIQILESKLRQAAGKPTLVD